MYQTLLCSVRHKMQHKHHALNRKEYGQYTKTQHSSTNYTTAEVPDFELSLQRKWVRKY